MQDLQTQDGLEAVLESVDLALDGDDPSWKKESWNQNAVPRGALLQPLYTLMADFAPGVRKKLMKPLELKAAWKAHARGTSTMKVLIVITATLVVSNTGSNREFRAAFVTTGRLL